YLRRPPLLSRPAALGNSGVSEDDVAEDEQAPAIAEHLDSGVERAPRPRLIRFAHTACGLPPPGTTVPASGCKPQAEGATRAEAGREGCADPPERVRPEQRH